MSTSAVVCSFFDRNAQSNNLLTLSEWRFLGSLWIGTTDPWKAARKYAQERGGAMVMKADDSLVVFTLRENGKISQKTHKPGKWAWA